MITAMMGPLARRLQETPVAPDMSIGPTVQIATSTPMLWTKSRATEELPQRISTTGMAVKP